MKVKVIVEVAMDIGHLIIQVNNVTHYILSVTVILIAAVQQIVLGMGINNVNLETLLQLLLLYLHQLLLLIILQLFFLPSLRLFQKDVTQSTTRIASRLLTHWMMNRAKSGYLLVLETIAFLWEKNVLTTNPVAVVHLNALEITTMLPVYLRKRIFIVLKTLDNQHVP